MKIDIGQLEFIHPLLREMVLDIERQFAEFTVTSLFRIGDKGVHGTLPLRGIDLRCHDDRFGRRVAEYANDKWSYDPSRPAKVVCMFHNTGQGDHLHFQVHPKTKKLKG